MSSQPEDNKRLTNQSVKMAKHKHEIRKKIHKQLASLWMRHPVLSSVQYCKDCKKNHALESGDDDYPHNLEALNSYIVRSVPQFSEYKFCPLVCGPLGLQCALDILILRQDGVGGVYRSGDLDNRIKTLIDGLTTPKEEKQISAYPIPEASELPFFTLMQDDNIISGLKVETDIRHEPRPGRLDKNELAWVTAIIQVEVKPLNPNFLNLSFM
jgi:hypothetical protein